MSTITYSINSFLSYGEYGTIMFEVEPQEGYDFVIII